MITNNVVKLLRNQGMIELKLLIIVLLATFFFSGCNSQANEVSGALDNDVDVSDCSKIVVPNDTEVNTNLNEEKGIIDISWFDSAAAKDITHTIRLADKDTCSESVIKIIEHIHKH
jgi:PBP1b-binding outer membrane lipoprotein LpoB